MQCLLTTTERQLESTKVFQDDAVRVLTSMSTKVVEQLQALREDLTSQMASVESTIKSSTMDLMKTIKQSSGDPMAMSTGMEDKAFVLHEFCKFKLAFEYTDYRRGDSIFWRATDDIVREDIIRNAKELFHLDSLAEAKELVRKTVCINNTTISIGKYAEDSARKCQESVRKQLVSAYPASCPSSSPIHPSTTIGEEVRKERINVILSRLQHESDPAYESA